MPRDWFAEGAMPGPPDLSERLVFGQLDGAQRCGAAPKAVIPIVRSEVEITTLKLLLTNPRRLRDSST